jgi:phosphoglycolate phosphatase
MVITDLDNTLFDWFDIWHKSFSAMLNSLLEQSHVEREVLIPQIREIHQRHGTAEYAFLIEELPCLRKQHPGENLVEVYADSIQAFRTARTSTLRLYPGVSETLEFLRECGCRIVGYTESQRFYSLYRIRHLGLDGLLDFVYTPPDHPLPAGLSEEEIRLYPPDKYRLRFTEHRYTPQGELKPNPKLLADIIKETGGIPQGTIYVGDDLIKDVGMAQAAKVLDVHAKYGEAYKRPEYELLREVTHWSPESVQKQKELGKGDIKPKYELERSFAEIRDFFDFVPLCGTRCATESTHS